MIDENRDCFEILKQVSAVNGALSSLQKMMLAQHIHGCLELALSSERDRTDLVDELVKHLSEVR
jgi:DNA-binding FrmR family transcriptional regulator